MRFSLQKIRDNKITFLQFSSKEEVVTSNFDEFCAALRDNTSIKTIISHHLSKDKFLQITNICDAKGINYLNIAEHIVTFDGVSKPHISHSPKQPSNSSDRLYEIAKSIDSAELIIEPETLLDVVVLPNNNLLVVQYAARPISTFEQINRLNDGTNVKIIIIDLTNKTILGHGFFSSYRGMEVCPSNSNHVAILSENKIFIMEATTRFTQINKFDLPTKSVKYLPDGKIIAIPLDKKTTSYFLINPSTLEINPIDKTQFHEVNPETNQTTPSRAHLQIDKVVVLSPQKLMTITRNAAEMLTFKNDINTRERFITEADNHYQLTLDANTVAVGSGAGIKIWDSKSHFNCSAANRFQSNVTFSKLLYFAEQKLLASVFTTCIYFWEKRGRELTLKGVFPIPKDCRVAVTADHKLLVTDCREGKLKINKFDIIPLQPVLDIQKEEEMRASSAPRLPFFSPQPNSLGTRAQSAPAASQPVVFAPSIFPNRFQAPRP